MNPAKRRSALAEAYEYNASRDEEGVMGEGKAALCVDGRRNPVNAFEVDLRQSFASISRPLPLIWILHQPERLILRKVSK